LPHQVEKSRRNKTEGGCEPMLSPIRLLVKWPDASCLRRRCRRDGSRRTTSGCWSPRNRHRRRMPSWCLTRSGQCDGGGSNLGVARRCARVRCSRYKQLQQSTEQFHTRTKTSPPTLPEKLSVQFAESVTTNDRFELVAEGATDQRQWIRASEGRTDVRRNSHGAG